MNDNNRKLYEVSFLVRDEAGAASVTGHLTRLGAGDIKTGELKKIKLTYPIKKETSAYLGSIICELEAESVAKLNEATKLDKDILRLLVVEPETHSDGAFVASPSRLTRDTERAPRRRVTKKEEGESGAVSNELLEEKLEEILQ